MREKPAGGAPRLFEAASEAQLAEAASRPVIKQRPWVTIVLLPLVVLGAAMLIGSLITNPGFDWPVVWQYLFDSQVLHGVALTVELTVYAMVLGVVLGTAIAVMQTSANLVVRSSAATYIWFFRGTPLLVQLLFWGFAAAVYPRIGLGIPWGPEFISWDTNTIVSFAVAAVLGLGLNEAAYVAEIVRGGMLSVPKGQSEAAHALGLSNASVLRRVVLPQALRVIIPPLGNETISMLKTTSLALVIGVAELLNTVSQIYARNFRQIPLLIVATIWYLAMTSVLTYLQRRLERRLGRSVHPLRARRRLSR